MAEPRKGRKNNTDRRSSTVIVVRVIPRSSKITISQEGPSSYKVRLTSAPVDGAANAQLLQVLSGKLSLPVRDIRMISGEKSRMKRVQIHGLDLAEITERLL